MRRTLAIESTTLLLVLALAGLLAAAFLIPSRWLDAADGVPEKYKILVSKLTRYLNSPEDADVVIVSSSLMLIPAVRCDDSINGLAPCYNRWYYFKHFIDYDKACHLQSLLSNAVGSTVTVKNLAVASSVVSDHAGIVDALFAAGKRPKLIVCCVAPRDFLDNTFPDWQNTPTRWYLNELITPVSILPRSFDQNTLDRWSQSCRRHLNKVLAKIRTTATFLTCRATGHPARLEFTRSELEVVKPNFQADLNKYKLLYNPPNFKMLSSQANFLQHLVEAAAAHNCSIVLVNMPLTRDNKDACDPRAYQKFLSVLRNTGKSNVVTFVDASSEPVFSRKDFEDSCHLNADGGFKLYEIIVQAVKDNQKIVAALASPSRDRSIAQGQARLQ